MVRTIRKKMGLTPAAAERVGVDVRSVRSWEKAWAEIFVYNRYRLAEALGVPPWILLASPNGAAQ